MNCPYYHLVPKDPFEHANRRLEIREKAFRDKKYRAMILQMCREDPLFFINSFLFIPEPRFEDGFTLPFNTFPFQDEAIMLLLRNVRKRDIGYGKSRAAGGTLLVLAALFWMWMFRPNSLFLLVSRNEKLVDESDNEDTLFAKLDFFYKHLPSWMKPKTKQPRPLLKFKNQDNGSAFNGASTTGDIGRGGRRMAIFLDEFAAFEVSDGFSALAATQAVTNTRIFLSTPGVPDEAFYRVMKGDSNMARMDLCWWDNPLCNKGLYSSEAGKLVIKDRGYEFPPDYEFILDGRLRSPWYDFEWRKPGSTPKLMAKEYDLDYESSVSKFIDESFLKFLVERDGQDPHGVLPVLRLLPEKAEDSGFIERISGCDILLWLSLNPETLCPPRTGYVIAIDVSAGTGASESAISVASKDTREKVAEFACGRILSHELALLACKLGELFCDENGTPAMMIWESRGPGREFGQVVMDRGYRRIYYQQNEFARSHKQTDTPGFSPSIENKRVLLENYRTNLLAGDYRNRSRIAIQQISRFVMTAGGYAHVKNVAGLEPDDAGENHGDRVIADALAVKLLGQRRDVIIEQKKIAPPGSLADIRLKMQRGKEEAGWRESWRRTG